MNVIFLSSINPISDKRLFFAYLHPEETFVELKKLSLNQKQL